MSVKILDLAKELLEVAYKNKETLARLETNWEFDRKDFSEFQSRLGHLEVEVKALRDEVRLLPKRTEEKMDGVVSDIEQAATEVKEAIVEKKEIILDKKPKSWWHFW